MTLGQRIQELRKQYGLSQEALGEKLGVSRQAVSRWEMDGAVPEVDKLIAMAKLFQVSLGQLVGNEEPQASTKGDKLTRRWLWLLTAVCLGLAVGLSALWSQNRTLARGLSMMDADYGAYHVRLFQAVEYRIEEIQMGFRPEEADQPLQVELDLTPVEEMDGWDLTAVHFSSPDGDSFRGTVSHQGDSYRASFTQPDYDGTFLRATAVFTQKGTGLAARQMIWAVEGQGEQGIIQELSVLGYQDIEPEALIPEALAIRLP